MLLLLLLLLFPPRLMLRLWVALLLSLSLWPQVASASTGAPLRDARSEIAAVSAEYGDEAARPTGSLEIVQRLAVRSFDAGTRAPAPGGALPVRGAAVLSIGSTLAPSAQPLAEGCAPCCERLPYHSTAPPSLR